MIKTFGAMRCAYCALRGLASEWEVFQLLAKAMVAGDVSIYQPTEAGNTNWRNWMDK